MPETTPRRLPRPLSARGWSVRTRVLSTVVLFMAMGLAVTGVLTYAAQFRVLEERLQSELEQELSELELIAKDTDEDGEYEHESVDEVLRAATTSAVPSDNETVLALIDGVPAYKPFQQDFELVGEGVPGSAEMLAEIERLHVPGRTVTTTVQHEGRDLRMLIASVRVAGDDAEGIFVVAADVGPPQAELWRSVATFTVMSLLALLVAAVLAYLVTGRMLRPLESLREATEQITVDDLERRVPVPEGRDDIAALARNFNRMLARIQAGFVEQRRFMSDVGHELRTPLTIVRGTLETTDPGDPADVREAHEIAIDELDRMGRVVGDLSELAASSRPDFVRPRRTDLGDAVRSAFSRLPHIGEREWVLERTPEGTVLLDQQRLTQALVQLAANAVRYSEPGTRIAVIADRVAGPAGPELHVAVRDQGIGIAAADQERIFERFTRVEGAPGSGSGLGLPIVRAIAEGHDGEVRVESTLGEGSTFTLVLPWRTPADGDTGDESAVSEGPTERPGGSSR
ncbi:HAMP domain-containing sensor histidine kinase [Brachybacterium sp. J144]|uniref:sensor histidine kinase n=1 Tax=Brachybacterium sp. J144 TaxID=3116487 RepID=UPI002E788AD8|nr:HAMP domain-containing sensor histidine kinase [Brachybacterium sp. J144]MEE1650099.1 HAMP domain-containing sensor histidine kinase [Brachybacterium sp. J144]